MPRTQMEVTLVDYAQLPFEKLYVAYRTDYSHDAPQEIWEKVSRGSITKEKIREFVKSRLDIGHTSPLEHLTFWFALSGLSRALSHQFVRQRIGMSPEQQSQRYVKYREDELIYVMPDSVQEKGFTDEYIKFMCQATKLYLKMLTGGVPAEDARYVLPNATPTNINAVFNFQALLHLADERLCTRAQWEFRKLVAMMRAAIKRELPELAIYMQPKCGEHRMACCNESFPDWTKCPLGKKRPHKSLLTGNWREVLKMMQQMSPRLLNEEDFKIITEMKTDTDLV